MLTKKEKMSETYLVGTILAVVGGYLDVYTYISRGEVFANAQTGNIILFGIKLARGNFWQAFCYFLPIAAFILGVVLAESIRSLIVSKHLHWKQIVIVIEILTLFIVAFIPAGRGDIIANVLVSFVSSLQIESFRKVAGNVYATTMCTGNLRSGSELLFQYVKTGNKEYLISGRKYFGIIVFFILGAVLGLIVTNYYGTKAVMFACLGLITVFGLLFMNTKESRIKSND
jgi:uncharacterized membrane protein YoaK (UPF0700 family)